MAKGLVCAMEEIAEQEEIEMELPEDAPAAADSLETDMLEVNERSNKIDETNEAIEEAVEDADTLEDIASVMDESTENGGMDQTSARVAEIAIESIYARLNVRKTNAMPAMESFGAKSTRITATKFALENIQTGLKAIWEGIKAAAIKVWSWITSFFQTIMNTAGKLKERAVALAAKVKALGTTEASVKTVDVGLLIAYNGGVDLDNLFEMVKGGEANVDTLSKDMTNSDISKAGENEAAVEKVSKDKVELAGFTTDGKADENGTVTFVSKKLPDGSAIVITQASPELKGLECLKAYANQKARKAAGFYNKGVAKEDNTVTDVEAKEVPVASAKELGAICEKVSVMAGIIATGKNVLAKIKSASTTFINMIKNIASKVSSGVSGAAEKVEGAAKSSASAVQKAFSAISSSVSGFINSVYNSGLSYGKKFLDYVEKQLAAWKAPKAEAAPKAE